MDPMSLVFVVGIPLAFTTGVVVHKYVVSEAQSIKQHVTDAETRIRNEFSAVKSQLDFIKKL